MQTPEPSTQPGGDRRRYRPPALTVFGAAVAVTANGSGTQSESSASMPSNCSYSAPGEWDWNMYDCGQYRVYRG